MITFFTFLVIFLALEVLLRHISIPFIFACCLLIFLHRTVNCTQNLEQPANALVQSETTSYFNAACGPSGYKCVNQIAYKSCDRTKRILYFCHMGSVCEDTGSEICIPQPPPCTHEGGFHIPGNLIIFILFFY